jgi:hypothetical protein
MSMAKSRKLVTLRGCVSKRWQEHTGGWGRNASEGIAREAGRPAGIRAFVCRLVAAREWPAGVRGPIRAGKSGNADGAKGTRELETIMTLESQAHSAAVTVRSKQAEDVRARWA